MRRLIRGGIRRDIIEVHRTESTHRAVGHDLATRHVNLIFKVEEIIRFRLVVKRLQVYYCRLR